MYCKKCGNNIPDDTVYCPICGQNQVKSAQQPIPVAPPQVSIDTHLTGAILTTLCCCLPFGIVAIVYASKVSGLVSAGRYAEAQDASNKANMWMWIAFGLGLLGNIIVFGVQFLGALAATV